LSSRKHRRSQLKNGNCVGEQKRSHHHGTHEESAPHAARSAVDAATTPAPAPVAPAAGDSPAAAVLAALSAEPAGVAVAVIAARAGISTAAARQVLIAHEKNGTATRVKGSRPGIADTWTPPAPEAPRDEAPPAETPGAGSTADAGQSDAGQPAAEPAASTADASQPAPGHRWRHRPGPAGGSRHRAGSGGHRRGGRERRGHCPGRRRGREGPRGREPGRRPGRPGDCPGPGRPGAAGDQGRRIGPARTRPGALRDLVEEHLRKFPDTAFTPHEVGKVLTRSAGAVANVLDKLVSLGTAQMVTDKTRTYRLATAAPAPEAARPGGGRRPRHQRGGHAQRRVTRGPPTARPGRQRMPPRPRRLHVYLPCPKSGWPAVPLGVTPSRRAGQPPPPARYIRALTGVVSRQVHDRDRRGTRRATGGGRGFPQQPL
jgi:DprA winged helix domain